MRSGLCFQLLVWPIYGKKWMEKDVIRWYSADRIHVCTIEKKLSTDRSVVSTTYIIVIPLPKLQVVQSIMMWLAV